MTQTRLTTKGSRDARPHRRGRGRADVRAGRRRHHARPGARRGAGQQLADLPLLRRQGRARARGRRLPERGRRRSQEQDLQSLSSVADLRAWRDHLVDHQRRLQCQGGCPIGALGSELGELDHDVRTGVSTGYHRWQRAIREGYVAMQANGTLLPSARRRDSRDRHPRGPPGRTAAVPDAPHHRAARGSPRHPHRPRGVTRRG